MIRTLLCTTLLLAGSAFTSIAAPILSVTPSTNSVTVGDNFTLNVNVSSAVDLFAWQLDISFGPQGLLTANSITEGSFLGAGTSFTAGTINNATATILATANSLSGFTGVTGNGVLAQISFTAAAIGNAVVSISNIQLLDSNLDSIFPGSPLFATVNIASAGPTVPEPSTFALIGIGVALGALARRRS